MTGIIGSFIELEKNQAIPWPWVDGELEEADFASLTEEGLHAVNWTGDYPDHAQVYLAWEPRVYAVWEVTEKTEETEGDTE